MKDLTPEMKQALSSNSVSLITAVYIDVSDTEKVRVHSGLGDFKIDGEIYTGIGDLGSIDAIAQDGSTSPNGIAMTISGLDPTLISSVLLDGYQGREVTIKLCAFIGDDFTSIHDHITYSGLLDTMEINYGKTATITVNVENALIAWFRSNTSRWNANTHKRMDPLNANDNFFSEVEEVVNKEIIFDPYIRRN